MSQTFCPKHFTLEDVDCAEPIVDCPPRVEFDPTKHALVSCGPCDRTRVVPVDRIMKGKVQNQGTCQLDKCAAQLVLPERGTSASPEAVAAHLTQMQSSIDAAVQGVDVPERHALVPLDVLEELRDKAARYDDLNDEPTPETAAVVALGGAADPSEHTASIDQAAKPRKGGKATSQKPAS